MSWPDAQLCPITYARFVSVNSDVFQCVQFVSELFFRKISLHIYRLYSTTQLFYIQCSFHCYVNAGLFGFVRNLLRNYWKKSLNRNKLSIVRGGGSAEPASSASPRGVRAGGQRGPAWCPVLCGERSGGRHRCRCLFTLEGGDPRREQWWAVIIKTKIFRLKRCDHFFPRT